jgi:U3 small nucleolar RNA-associated protein 6
VAKREGARMLAGRILARALQLHTSTPMFYILAASEELNNLSPSTARTLLQRGIRLNPDSIELWREHVRLELGFIESLRRRWKLLGVDMTTDENKVADPSLGNDAELTDVAARNRILGGALVKTVIDSACSAIPSVDLFVALRDTISEHPSPAILRSDLIEHLHGLIPQHLPNDPKCIKLVATRHLSPSPEGEALVDAIRLVNTELLSHCRQNLNSEPVLRIYAEFVEEWIINESLDSHLKDYLIASLFSLIKSASKSPSLLACHLRCLIIHPPQPPNTTKLRCISRKYTSRVPSRADVWLAALDLEKSLGTPIEDLSSLCGSARASTRGNSLEEIWLWGLDSHSLDGPSAFSEQQKIYQRLLRESMQDPLLSSIHEQLLQKYAELMYTNSPSAEGRKEFLQQLTSNYHTSGVVWDRVFELESSLEGANESILKDIHTRWREKGQACTIDAALAWGSWLLTQGRGKEASDVVMSARALLADEQKAVLEKRWSEVLDGGQDGEELIDEEMQDT